MRWCWRTLHWCAGLQVPPAELLSTPAAPGSIPSPCQAFRDEHVAYPKCMKTLERVKGIEPSSSAWKAVALPLSYTRSGWNIQVLCSECNRRKRDQEDDEAYILRCHPAMVMLHRPSRALCLRQLFTLSRSKILACAGKSLKSLVEPGGIEPPTS